MTKTTEEQIRTAMFDIKRQYPEGAATFGPCVNDCGSGISARGSGPCAQCCINTLAALTSKREAINYDVLIASERLFTTRLIEKYTDA